MIYLSLNFKYLIAFLMLLAIVYGLSINLPVNSQTVPELLITWGADNYVPSEYQSRILPISNTAINVALELIVNGKLTNISAYEVRWFVDDELQASGFGMKNFNFEIDSFVEDSIQSVGAEIINYKGQKLKKTIDLPIAKPEVIIIRNEKNIFQAKPYFFNIKELENIIFSWSINGVGAKEAGSSDTLLLKFIGTKTTGIMSLNLTAQNINSPLEVINKFINFSFE